MNPIILANEVRMMRSVHHGAIGIVEGPTDKRLARHLLGDERSRFVFAHGKDNALDALAILNGERFPGVYCIADADFWRIRGNTPGIENLVLSECHDVECMMARAGALSRLIIEFTEAERVSECESKYGYTLIDIILGIASPIGVLRLAAEVQGWPFRFEHLKIADIVHADGVTVDNTRLCTVVRDRSRQHGIQLAVIEEQYQQSEQLSAAFDRWELCCGDDVLSAFEFLCRNCLGGRSRSDIDCQALARGLRVSYPIGEFQKTTMYRDLLTWQRTHPGFPVVCDEEPAGSAYQI